ncbi:hypothetical protein AB6A40_010675 [Gnathostoma spinigerum]|uniref:Uncharacterized protein n=1 Tax=Gnathostoma spinigerum TaxID=75299 RepID=A0ABD6F1K9_9BILA
MESIFKKKTRDEWCEIFKDVDACVTPVLDMEEVGDAECHKDRDYFLKAKDSWIPRPAPRMYTVEEYEKLRNSRCLNESK